jgi:hypothetical protein
VKNIIILKVFCMGKKRKQYKVVNAAAENFFHLLKSERIRGKPMPLVRKHAKVFSIILNYSITQNESMARMGC